MNTKGVEDGMSDEPMWVKQRRLATCDCWKYSQQVCDICQGVGGGDKTAPVPEERTAEMEQALELLRKMESIIFMHLTVDVVMEGPKPYLKNKSALPQALHKWRIKLDESGLLDHIEGKAKAEEVQE